MSYFPPSKCAVCGSEMNITKLSCPNCKSELSGTFTPCKYCSLSEKHKLFLDTFLQCRGNIKEVERSLSISYPTVKGLLDELLTALFPEQRLSDKPTLCTSEILDMLEKKEINAEEAARMLSELK
ncbi:MAG: DUF2089 domain-containing protein [Clostridiales bacterium]|nr:DUF2089 domain-containing protein [Clostridiales bacterium]